MQILSAIIGIALILIVLGDTFETIVLPRRVVRKIRLTRFFYRVTWTAWLRIVCCALPQRHRETYLGFFGPLSVILLLSIWAAGLITGFALLFWSEDSFAGWPQAHACGIQLFESELYLSGSNFFTLGLVHPDASTAVKALTIAEAGIGFGFLAMVISYLPGLNQSFSRREINISLMDARAGSPSSAVQMLLRHREDLVQLNRILFEWERWAAELLENQLSYPVLAHFRSQHDNQSWLAALTTILDTSALIISGSQGPCRSQAAMTFAMARHTVVDLAIVFGKPPREPAFDRLPPVAVKELLEHLAGSGLEWQEGLDFEKELLNLRRMYDPYVESLSAYLHLSIPPWDAGDEYLDNWRRSPWEPDSLVRARGLSSPEGHF